MSRAAAVGRPPRTLTGRARREWASLAVPTPRSAVFDPAMVVHLPPPVRRWLVHAIAPGTALLRSVELAMHGEIRLGAWRRFEAAQILTPPQGFLWAATAHLTALPVSGFDRYSNGTGEMRWRLLGAFPVMSGAGADITRSAAGRLAGEFVFVPTAALGPAIVWEPIDDRRAVARVPVGEREVHVTVEVAASGALESVTLCRWGDPDRSGYREHVFGAGFQDEAVFGGFTIPRTASAGWWYGTERWSEGEFFRFTIDRAVYR